MQHSTKLGCNHLAEAQTQNGTKKQQHREASIHPSKFPHQLRLLRENPPTRTIDAFLRSAGSGIANTGKAIHDGLDGFGQEAGTALDSWGKEVGKDMDPSHPVHIAMEKTGQVSFGAARASLSYLDQCGQHTETSVSEAYNQTHEHVSKVDWDKLSQDVRAWIESAAKDLGVAVAVAAENVWCIAEAHLPEEIAQWIANNAGQITFLVVAGTVFFAPFLIKVPVLNSLGFATKGVAAGA
jgi:hypothetical protein